MFNVTVLNNIISVWLGQLLRVLSSIKASLKEQVRSACSGQSLHSEPSLSASLESLMKTHLCKCISVEQSILYYVITRLVFLIKILRVCPKNLTAALPHISYQLK